MTNSKDHQEPDFIFASSPFRSTSATEYFRLNLEEDKVVDWPMVYILNSPNKAYIGQTTSIARRITEHSKSSDKQDLNNLNVIYHPHFNSSVVTDYESRIIQLMYADEKFQILNRNDGLTDSNYFAKNKYQEMFADLWSILQAHGLAKQSISDIEQSTIFKFSPYKELNGDQTEALAKILEAIKSGASRPIVVEGQPGTGKTILAIYLLKLLKDDPKYKDKNIKIVIPQQGLRETIQEVFKKTQSLAASDVISPLDVVKEKHGYRGEKESYDVLIVDEAHRLNRRKNIVNYASYDKATRKLGMEDGTPQIDWIRDQAKIPIFFFDSLQNVGPAGTGLSLLEERLGVENIDHYSLESQMRVRGGNDYLDYILQILNNQSPSPITDFGGEYDLKLFESFESFNKFFYEKQKEHALTRMLAGYAWKWESKKNSEAYDIKIQGIRKRWNTEYANWIARGFYDPKYLDEVGCIHTSQGYDLSYAFVILGNDIRYNSDTKMIEVDKSNYFDRNGKNTATQEDLEQYIRNIYYVLLTRGVFGTYIYACDPGMQLYLSQFMTVV